MFGLPYPTDHEHFSVLGIYHRRKILLFDVADSSLSIGLKTTTTNKQTNIKLFHNVHQLHGIKIGMKATKNNLQSVSAVVWVKNFPCPRSFR